MTCVWITLHIPASHLEEFNATSRWNIVPRISDTFPSMAQMVCKRTSNSIFNLYHARDVICFLVTYAPVPFESEQYLSPQSYEATSVTRSCAKIYLGNTCRRDWLGAPLITCITTCDRDYCNCDKRSPPPDMFPDGKPLAVAPNTSTYYTEDMSVCNKLNQKRKQMILEKLQKDSSSRKHDVNKRRKNRQQYEINSSYRAITNTALTFKVTLIVYASFV